MFVSQIFSSGGSCHGGGDRRESGHYESRGWHGGGRRENNYYESGWRGRRRGGERDHEELLEVLGIGI
ncbi:MAG: hypothetical protein M3Y73_19975 [Actinomycetota bacterium]|nr:hypothetical protein [Actinomycetota bacterium]